MMSDSRRSPSGSLLRCGVGLLLIAMGLRWIVVIGAKQLALARRAARRERRLLAGSALVEQPTGMVREPSASHHCTQPAGDDRRRTGRRPYSPRRQP